MLFAAAFSARPAPANPNSTAKDAKTAKSRSVISSGVEKSLGGYHLPNDAEPPILPAFC